MLRVAKEIKGKEILNVTLFVTTHPCTNLAVISQSCKYKEVWPLTKNCGCWIYSHSIPCCAGVVGTCSLHFWNIQVLFITENIWYITMTPRNCRFWISFHLANNWCSLSSANKEFLFKSNLGGNCGQLRKMNNLQLTRYYNKRKIYWVLQNLG